MERLQLALDQATDEDNIITDFTKQTNLNMQAVRCLRQELAFILCSKSAQ